MAIAVYYSDIIFIMSENQIRLKPISPCKNVDRIINLFVQRKQNTSATSQFVNSLYTPQKKNRRTRSTFKSSLADWRLLYSGDRPKTQSLISPANARKTTAQCFYPSNQSHQHLMPKFFTAASPMTAISPMSTYTNMWNIQKVNPEKSPKTAINFYKSPLRDQLNFLQNLNARMGAKSRKRSFRHRQKFGEPKSSEEM